MQFAAERRGDDRRDEHRHQRAGELRHQLGEMDVAGQHHMRRADARMRGDDALSHAGRIDLQHRRILEDARAGGFRRGRKPERIVERMQAEAARIMQPVKIARRMQRLAHPLGRPRLDRHAEFAGHERRFVRHRAACRRSSTHAASRSRTIRRPASRARRSRTYSAPATERAHSALAASRPTRSISASGLRGKSRQHDAGVAARCAPGDALRLQHHDRPAEPRDLARGGQAGKARADDADIDVELDGQPRAGRAFHPRRGMPVRAIGLGFGRQHEVPLVRRLGPASNKKPDHA